jgi:hypothetical protein
LRVRAQGRIASIVVIRGSIWVAHRSQLTLQVE